MTKHLKRDDLVKLAHAGETDASRDASPEVRYLMARARVVAHLGRDLTDDEKLTLRGLYTPGSKLVENADLRSWLLGEVGAEPAPDEGRKDDADKAPYDLIAPELLEDVAAVLKFGAAKYAPRGWEKGMRWGRPFAAAMRHLWAWWRGEATDPETGLSHLAHAACCVMFLLAYEKRGVGEDDRPKEKADV